MRRERVGMGWAAVVVLLFGILLSGCASTATRRSAGEYLDDAVMANKIRTKLIADPLVSFFDISVEVFRGRVVLSGFVTSEAERERAIALAKEVPGVRDVQAAVVVKPRAAEPSSP